MNLSDGSRDEALRMSQGYKQALKWIVDNDDTEWLDDEKPIISVTAALIADLFNKTDEKVIADLNKLRGE